MGLKLNTASSGSVTLEPADTASNLTITVPAVTGTMITTASTFAGTGPAFSAYKSANQTGVTPATWTKVTFDTEEFDTNSNYSTATSRFTPTVAGYYQFNWELDTGGVTTTATLADIYKNGGAFKRSNGVFVGSIGEQYVSGSALIYANGSTDYFEVYVYIAAGSNATVYGGSPIYGFFQASLVRAA